MLLKVRTACQDHQAGEYAVKCLPKDKTKLCQKVLNQDRVDHNHGVLN